MELPSIKRNYIYKLLYEILLVIAPLITAPYVSRVLGPDGVGIYSFTLSNMTYFTLFAALGTVSYGTREIARVRDDKRSYSKLFWEIELVTVITTAISLAAWLLFVFCTTRYKFYYIALIPQLLAVATDISWFFTGLERIGYTVFWNSICKILGIVLIFMFVRDRDDLLVYILILTGTVFWGNVSMWIHLPRFLVKTNVQVKNLKNHLKETLVYFIPAAATSIYTVLDKTLIGLITNDSYANGYYEQATKITNICKSLVFTSVNSVMNARMAYLFAKEKYEEVKDKINIALSFILMLAFGCTAGIITVSNKFIPWFFGQDYKPAILLLNLMSPLIVIIGISNCLGAQYYTPSGRRLQSAKYIIIGAATNLVCNLVLIPTWGAAGATIGSIVAETTITVLYVSNCDRIITYSQIWSLSKKRLFAAFIMLITDTMIGNILPFKDCVVILIQIAVGVTIYFISLIMMRDELLFILWNNLLHRKRKKSGKKSFDMEKKK